MIRAFVVIATTCVLAACAEPEQEQRPKPVKLSDTVTRVCDGTTAIYSTLGQWTTTHTIRENDQACGGGE